jgi:hypothetical protein
MSTPHPTIQYLAIGREPNTDRPIENTIGPYDFRLATRCGFWNTSYSMLGKICGYTTREIKQRCVERGGSPLIYADSLPHGLLSHVADKTDRRSKISSEVVAEHVSRIFSQRVLLDRVRIVILSGLEGAVFAPAVTAFKQRCAEASIPAIELPFFYGTNTRKIELLLTAVDRQTLQAIWQDFESSPL